jgi:hypothetical protein
MSKVLFLQFGQHSIIVDSYFASETNLIINLISQWISLTKNFFLLYVPIPLKSPKSTSLRPHQTPLVRAARISAKKKTTSSQSKWNSNHSIFPSADFNIFHCFRHFSQFYNNSPTFTLNFIFISFDLP